MVLLATLPSACAAPESHNRVATSRDTLPGGRIKVTNYRDSAHELPADGWELVEDLRVGTIDGPEETRFSYVLDVTTDSHRNIYVLDRLSSDVRRFSSTGEPMGRLGGFGEGPGEFVSPIGMDVDELNRVWVVDVRNRRYTVFGPDFAVIHTWRRASTAVVLPWRGSIIGAGQLLDWDLDGPDRRADGLFGSVTLHVPVVTGLGVNLDTFPPLSHSTVRGKESGAIKPFSGRLTYVGDTTGGIWFASTDEFTIYRRNLAGDTLLELTLPVRAAAVTPPERDSVVAASARGSSPWSPDDIPLVKEVIERIFTDGASYVYVITQEDGVRAGTVADVFAFDGEYLGRMVFPEPIEFNRPAPHATESHIYAVVYDDFDVPYVVRFRITR